MLYSAPVLVAVVLAVIAWRLAANYWKLRSIPSPVFASCSSLWQLYFKRTGQLLRKLEQLHERHGPVVRYAPNTVSVSDPAAVSAIYGFSPIWNKPESYHPTQGWSNGTVVPSLLSITSEKRHSAIRRPVAPAFASKSILAYEHLVDQTADELIASLSQLGSADLSRWTQYFTMDALSRIAFSESMGFVANGNDIGNTMSTIEARFAHWNRWSAMPTLESLIYKNPLYLKLTGSASALTALALGKLQLRQGSKNLKEQGDLLDKYMEASEAHPETFDDLAIMGLTMSTIAAGADTTAITLAAAIFYLITNREAYEKLQNELNEARESGMLSDIPQFSEVARLPYLDAVIKESMRCWPIFTAPIERVVPHGGLEVAGTVLPEGTIVGCHQSIIHKDPECYGADADVFNPDRWLNADDKQRRAMDRASLWFGSGKHICIGRHIAMLELKKVVPRLLRTFKMTMDNPSAQLKAKINALAYLDPIFVTFEKI